MSRLFAVAPTLSPTPSLTEQMTDKLRAEIKGGRYKVGQAIPTELQLGSTFGVSRTVVREAVSRLKADGLIKSRQGLGAFVSSTIGTQGFRIADAKGLRNARHILELRMGLEVEASGIAALRRHGKNLSEMRRALVAMDRSVVDGDLERGANADLSFHRVICAATQNPHFLTFFDYLLPYLRAAILLSRRRSTELLRRIGDSREEHELIFASIERQDAEAAQYTTRRHVSQTLKRLTLAKVRN